MKAGALLLLALAADAQTFNWVERFGVTHPRQVINFAFTGGIRKNTGYVMTGPQGSEVGWGQRTDGSIDVQSNGPRSLGYPVPLQWTKISNCNTASDYMELDAGFTQGPGSTIIHAALRVGDPVLVTAVSGTACGLTSGIIYYIQAVLSDTPLSGQSSYKFSATQGGGVFDLTSTGGTVTIQRVGFVQDTSDGTGDTLYAGTHDYVACDTMKPIAYTGTLPTGMSSTVYFIKSPTATSFKLSTSCNGATLDLTAASGSGVWLGETNFTWSLNAGTTAATVTNPVTVLTANANYLEVSNGLVGVRIPTAAGNPNPAQTWRMDQGAFSFVGCISGSAQVDFNSAHGLSPGDPIATAGMSTANGDVGDANNTMMNGQWTVDTAPSSTRITFGPTYCGTGGKVWNSTNSPYMTLIKGNPPNLSWSQGYLIAGTWSTATNRIKTESRLQYGFTGDAYNGTTDAFGILSYRVYFEESSSLRTTVVSEYVANRPTYWTGTVHGTPGIGFINVRQTILAGHRSILVEVDTDFQHDAKHNLYSAFPTAADRVRWRGHHSTSTACGYQTGGVVYANPENRPDQDAVIDFVYTTPRSPSYICNAGANWVSLIPWNGQAGNPDKGFYFQVYNSTAGSSEPVVGVYAGQASRMLTVGESGPVLKTTTTTLELISRIMKIRPTGDFDDRARLNYGIFFDTKANLPAATTSQQPISTERNILAGVSLSKQNQYVLTYSDPGGGWKPLYQGATAYGNVRSAIADGTAKCGSAACYYDKIYPNLQASGPGAAVLNMWRNGTTAPWLNMTLANLTVHANKWMYTLVNLNGNLDPYLSNAQAGYEVNKRVGAASALLLETLSSVQKDQVKAIASQFANVLWDNDFAPYDNNAGDSFGTANFPIQYTQYRAQSALFLNSQPLLATKQVAARASVLAALALAINQYGSGFDSTWYMDTGFEPTILNFMNMVVNGQIQCSDYPQIALHARWQASALTPPEPRFSSTSMRKWVSNGTGNTHSNLSPLLMSVLMNQCGDSTTAQLAQWVWQSMNRSDLYTIGDFFAFIPSALDDTITATDPNLGPQNFPGYWSVLRHGWATNNETAAYFINGNFYSDHRGTDYGETMLYAHKAPLCVTYNPNLYSPLMGSSYYNCATITRASDIGQAWDADNPGTCPAGVSCTTGNSGGGVVSGTQNDYAGFSKSSFSSATFAQSPNWTRIAQMGFGSAAYPIIRLKDTFASATSRVLTLPMMATGNLTVMGTSVAPTQRDNNNDTTKASNGTVYAMTTNALNRVQATGATWTAHATGGIDWDVYVVPSSTSQVLVGNWSHNQHNAREVSEYSGACSSGCSFGSSFRERQHIMRVEGQGSFDTIILPWRKGTAPSQTVSLTTCPGGTAGIQIARTSPSTETECINDGEYTLSSGSNRLLAIMDSSSHTAYSMTASGGPIELYYNGTNVAVTINGTVAAERQIDLSALSGGPWFPSIASVKLNGPINSSVYSTYHGGGAQPTPLNATFTTSAGSSTVKTYSFACTAASVILTFSDGSKIKGTCASSRAVVVARVPTGVSLSSWSHE